MTTITYYQLDGAGRPTGETMARDAAAGVPLGWVDVAPPVTGPGEVAEWRGTAWVLVAAPPAEGLEAARERIMAAAAARRWKAEVAGTTHAGVALKTDRESQGLVDSMDRALADGVIASVKFRTAGGVVLDVGPAEASAIRRAVVLHVQACRAREAEIIAAILAAPHIEAVEAIDIEAGWP